MKKICTCSLLLFALAVSGFTAEKKDVLSSLREHILNSSRDEVVQIVKQSVVQNPEFASDIVSLAIELTEPSTREIIQFIKVAVEAIGESADGVIVDLATDLIQDIATKYPQVLSESVSVLSDVLSGEDTTPPSITSSSEVTSTRNN